MNRVERGRWKLVNSASTARKRYPGVMKILVSPGQNEAKLLRLGFSVETTIHTGLADVRGEQGATTTRLTAPQP